MRRQTVDVGAFRFELGLVRGQIPHPDLTAAGASAGLHSGVHLVFLIRVVLHSQAHVGIGGPDSDFIGLCSGNQLKESVCIRRRGVARADLCKFILLTRGSIALQTPLWVNVD